MIISEDSAELREKKYKEEMRNLLDLKLPDKYKILHYENKYFVIQEAGLIFRYNVAKFYKNNNEIIIIFDDYEEYLPLKKYLNESKNDFRIKIEESYY